MKKLMMAVLSTLYFVPMQAFAQLTKPTNNYGLSTVETPMNLFMKVMNYLLGFVAALSVLMIVIGGVMYITAAGDSTKAGKAKDNVVMAVTGLVIVIISYAIVRIISLALGAS